MTKNLLFVCIPSHDPLFLNMYIFSDITYNYNSTPPFKLSTIVIYIYFFRIHSLTYEEDKIAPEAAEQKKK